jgi:hypothetical protein
MPSMNTTHYKRSSVKKEVSKEEEEERVIL